MYPENAEDPWEQRLIGSFPAAVTYPLRLRMYLCQEQKTYGCGVRRGPDPTEHICRAQERREIMGIITLAVAAVFGYTLCCFTSLARNW